LPVGERGAVARVVYGYFDGERLELFEGELEGEVATAPRGNAGFGWDKIFIPYGYEQTRAEMNKEDDEKTYCALHPFAKIREFLEEE